MTIFPYGCFRLLESCLECFVKNLITIPYLLIQEHFQTLHAAHMFKSACQASCYFWQMLSLMTLFESKVFGREASMSSGQQMALYIYKAHNPYPYLHCHIPIFI